MAILEILKIGHPTLTTKAEPVREIDRELVDLANNMVETMRAAPGLGLAAPQVDVSKRLITVDLSVGEDPKALIILVNPELVEKEGTICSDEGCLSVPGITEKVTRPYKVKVKGLDLQGRETEVEGEDILARALCHEIDHLDGKLFIERLSPLKRALIKQKFKKEEKKQGRSKAA
jgi:peptide deformylase